MMCEVEPQAERHHRKDIVLFVGSEGWAIAIYVVGLAVFVLEVCVQHKSVVEEPKTTNVKVIPNAYRNEETC